MERQFSSLVEKLPDALYKQFHSDRYTHSSASSDGGGSENVDYGDIGTRSKATATTWSNVRVNEKRRKHFNQHLATATFSTAQLLKENNKTYQNNNDWNAVSTMVKPISPNDQLIAAILDGDVQGVRTIVRSRGESLLSEYWKDLALSVLPLHRAISGLHFHGSDRKLINTIEALVQLGAVVDAQDQSGNTVLHKAIQVCTSTSVAAVVECILKKGASPAIRNHIGQCPIHVECSR